MIGDRSILAGLAVLALLLPSSLLLGCGSAGQSDVEEARSATEAKSTPMVRRPSAREQNAYDGRLGFIVPYRPDCPGGSVRKGAEPPKGFKEWCQRTGLDAGTKHGWYAEWYSDGRPSVAGEYRDGLQEGVWTRWYPGGTKRVQAEFKNGLQHGRLISWSEAGEKLGEQHYADGSAL